MKNLFIKKDTNINHLSDYLLFILNLCLDINDFNLII